MNTGGRWHPANRPRTALGRILPVAYWVGIPLLCAFLSAVVSGIAVDGVYELNNLELERAMHLGQSSRPDPNPAIAIIGIDLECRERLPLRKDGGFSRENYARLIRKLRRAGARTLLLDLIFYPPKPEDDAELVEALHEEGTMGITIANLYPQPSEPDPEEPDGSYWETVDYSHLRVNPTDDRVRAAHNSALTPGIEAIGVVMYRHDRRKQVWYQHVVLSSVLQFHQTSGREIRFDPADHDLSAGSLEWALQGNDALLVHWTESARPFPTFDFADTLLEFSDEELRARFEGKLVLVGQLEPTTDKVETEVGVIPGVEFLAQAINTALLPPGHRLVHERGFLSAIWLLSLGAIAALAAISPRIVWSLFGLAVLMLLSWTIPEVVVRSTGVIMETVLPAMTTFGSFLLGSAFRIWVHSPGRAEGSEFEATALFVDLRGSTQLLQNLGAQGYRQLYAEFSRRIATIARSHSGSVERTTGDGAMAIFAKSRVTNHAVHAAEAAIAIRKAVHAIEGPAKLDVLIGIESGVLTGTYVSEGGQRVWSSSGSAINLAKRLQEAGDEIRTSIRVGPVAARLMEGHVELTSAGEIVAQGFEGVVPVWKVSGEE